MTKSGTIFKRLLSGSITTIIHIVFKILLPVYIFTTMVGFTIVGINLGYTQEKVDRIIYYIIAFGIVSAGLAFLKGTSPKHSIRKPIAEFLFYFVSICYLYTYRLSGALSFENITIPINSSITTQFSLSLDNMIYVNMAIISLKMLIALSDIIKASFFPRSIDETTKTSSSSKSYHSKKFSSAKDQKWKKKRKNAKYDEDLDDLLRD